MSCSDSASGTDASDEEEVETAAEKRLRLAKEFIARVEDQEANKADGENIDHDAIAHRLQEDLVSRPRPFIYYFLGGSAANLLAPISHCTCLLPFSTNALCFAVLGGRPNPRGP